MNSGNLRSILAEPRVENPPGPGRRDWVLFALFAFMMTMEASFDPATPTGWLPAAILAAAVPIALLPWRRMHPLLTLAMTYGVGAAVDLASIAGGANPVGLDATAAALLYPYALVRWASGKHIVAGAGVLGVAYTTSVFSDFATVGDAVGAAVVLLLSAAIGANIRLQERSKLQRVDSARSQEREQLARELHDTVAHHVSAIALQAQGARAVLPTDPDMAADALATIEASASTTLADMRRIVGALRTDPDAPLTPQPGLNDIERLAATPTNESEPTVDVELSGDLANIAPSTATGLFRLAQEAVTNARRHAEGASHVLVRVVGSNDSVRLTVKDDGGPIVGDHAGGFGLVGMAERASLLGGTIDAGPEPDRGWAVRATLPRSGRTS